MSSQKQIDANRRNAKKSTGPVSPEGKARSRCNALRDGLTGQLVTLPPKDHAVFDQLKSEIVAGFKPETAMESRLADSIAWDTWRADRIRAVELNIYTLGREENAGQENAEGTEPDDLDTAFADACTFRAEADRFELMSRYEQRLTRNIHRNIALLRDLQAERKRNYERDKKEEVQIARVCEINEMPIKASTAPSGNGFIFSDEEIVAAVVRERYRDTAAYVLKHSNPNQLYGNLLHGVGDSFLEKVIDKRPLSAEERIEIDSVPPDIRALDRLHHPEEYGIRQS